MSELTRRAFLRRVSVTGAVILWPDLLRRFWRRPVFQSYPFTLGVASGDPTPDGVVLWTRLAPDPLRGGGMPLENVEVEWVVAEDERLSRVIRRGTAVAVADLAHSVHVEVSGLAPDRWYWYQFRVGGEASPLGRTRTAPRFEEQPRSLRFAFASCQHYEQGFYTAYRHMAAEDLDLVFHLGDYIYEYSGVRDQVRFHTYREIETLDDYRNRLALYKTDPDLQAAHAAFPWVVTWDDHEVDNDYAGAISENNDPEDAFLRRRAAAYQAYYEHMPLRRSSMPRGPEALIYRSLSFGRLAQFYVLDTRQYRTDQPCGPQRVAPPCPASLDPNATILGAEQRRWLLDQLSNSTARWNVLAQQVLMAPMDLAEGEEKRYSMDKWSGYAADRKLLLGHFASGRTRNPVVLTGDIHSNWVVDLKADPDDPTSPTVATELVGTSISSGGDGVDLSERNAAILAENPQIKFHNGQRGYVSLELAADRLTAHYRIVPYVSQPDAPLLTRASFVVEDGNPGAQPA